MAEAIVAADWTWVQNFFAFNWQDDIDGAFGLLDSNDNKKPALAAFVSLANPGKVVGRQLVSSSGNGQRYRLDA